MIRQFAVWTPHRSRFWTVRVAGDADVVKAAHAAAGIVEDATGYDAMPVEPTPVANADPNYRIEVPA